MYGTEFYFCPEACSWSDVKAYYGTGAWGVDVRFKVEIVMKEQPGMIWRGKGYALLLNITISNVQYSDTGVYYCAWSIRGAGVYQKVQITVVIPETEKIIEKVLSDLSPNPNDLPQDASTKDIEFIMSSNLSDNIKEFRTAKARCE